MMCSTGMRQNNGGNRHATVNPLAFLYGPGHSFPTPLHRSPDTALAIFRSYCQVNGGIPDHRDIYIFEGGINPMFQTVISF